MKVDEQFKCKDCDNYNLCKYYHNRRETSFICKEFQNQWGFIKELEKIKAEIEKEREEMASVKDWGRYYGLNMSLEIVDNHISELKGEQE